MSDFLLRLEAVNIESGVSDTRQLSVSRGGSLQLRAAADHLLSTVQHPVVQPDHAGAPLKIAESIVSSFRQISTGASSGLFAFTGSKTQALQLRDEIVAWLRSQADYCDHGFVVDIEPAPNMDTDFREAQERLIARNRFRQFQQPTIAFPEKNTNLTIPPCSWDNLRPANTASSAADTVHRFAGHDTPQVSAFTRNRHRYGREMKANFIREESRNQTTGEQHNNAKFTWNLQEIASYESLHGQAASSQAKANNPFGFLNHKLAILYADGNRFGRIQKALQGAEDLQRFDATVKTMRENFLCSLLDRASSDPDFKTVSRQRGQLIADAIRLEILLWGGDELTLIVPAWRGMQTLQLLFEKTRGTTFTFLNKSGDRKTVELTHSAGLLFFDSRTPIHRMHSLAQQMAERIKRKSLHQGDLGDDTAASQMAQKKETSGELIDPYSSHANLYNVLALESVDYPTDGYDNFIERRYKKIGSKAYSPAAPLASGSFALQQSQFRKFKDLLPRRQMYKIAGKALQGASFADQQKQLDGLMLQSQGVSIENIERTLAGFFPGVKSGPMLWIYLAELWDYFAPHNEAES